MYHERSLETYKDMIKSCLGFVDKIRSFIDSFLGKWILRMRCQRSRKSVAWYQFPSWRKELADQIDKLIKAITTFIRLISDKIRRVADQLKSVRFDSMVDVAEDVADTAGDFVSDAAEDIVDAASGFVSNSFNKIFRSSLQQD